MRSFLSNSIILILVMVFLTVSGLGCKKKQTEQTDTNITQPAQTKIETETKAETSISSVEPAAPEEPADNVVVTVNGFDITEQTLQQALQPQLARMNSQNQKLPPALKQTLEKQIRQQILEQLIVVRLLEEKAKESNIEVTEEEVMNQISQLLSAQRPPMSLEEYKQKAAEAGQNFDEIKEQIRKGLTYQKIVNSQWQGKVNITDDQAKKYYDDNTAEFETKEQVQASHILIKPATDDPGADPNQAKEKARAKTEDLLKQIKEGADFAALAKANSDCPSAPRGGDLGYFDKGKMVPPFEKAAFALKVGEVSNIVETQFGYHIIKLTDRKEAGTTSFEQAKADIIQKLGQKERIELANNYIESLKAAANIVYPPGKEPASSEPAPMIPQPQ